MWLGSKESKKISLTDWETVCMDKVEGGVGIRSMMLQNLVLGAKLIWKMFKSPEKMWCRIMRFKYLDVDDSSRILTIANSHGGSPIFFSWECRGIITDHLSWKIGNIKESFLLARFMEWRSCVGGDYRE